MSKMGNAIVDIQELAYQGVPNAEIAKRTKTSESFVAGIVEDMFGVDAEYYYDAQDFNNNNLENSG